MNNMVNNISNLSKDKYTIKAKSCQTITFMGARPNYFKITNGGNTALYLGVSMTPTEDFFDEKILPASTKLCVDAYGSEEVYILNPSQYDANIIITSFSAPFDASAVAMSGFGQDFSNIEMNGEIDATGDLKKAIEDISKNVADKKVTITNAADIKGTDYSGDIGLIRNATNNITGQLVEANTKLQDIHDYTTTINEIHGLLHGYDFGHIYEILETLKNTDYTGDFAGLSAQLQSITDSVPALLEIQMLLQDYDFGHIYEILQTLKSIDNKSGGTDTIVKEPITDSRLVMVTMGNLGDKSVKPGDYGLVGYTPNKIVSVSLPDSNDKIWVEVPCITGDNRTAVFIPWYQLEKVQNKPNNANLQADQIDSTEVVIEFSRTITNYVLVDELIPGDTFLGIYDSYNNNNVLDCHIDIFDDEGNPIKTYYVNSIVDNTLIEAINNGMFVRLHRGGYTFDDEDTLKYIVKRG